jgi:hypothetical protein
MVRGLTLPRNLRQRGTLGGPQKTKKIVDRMTVGYVTVKGCRSTSKDGSGLKVVSKMVANFSTEEPSEVDRKVVVRAVQRRKALIRATVRNSLPMLQDGIFFLLRKKALAFYNAGDNTRILMSL